jgi:Skp family chaperone for outer membrane proteins
MKQLLIGLVLIAAVVAGVGFWRGWFTFEKTRTDDGKTHVGVGADKDKFNKDKDAFKAAAAKKYQALKDKLASLRSKSKDLKGDAKAKADKEIEDLAKKHDALDAKMKHLDNAAEEKFDDVKQDVGKALDDLSRDHDKPN